MMDSAEIEALLQRAFVECANSGQPLSLQQQQILLRAIANGSNFSDSSAATNPLEELTPEQRQVLLDYVQEQESQKRSWKTQLLNDWLEGRTSGKVQFVREQYGLSWLERVQSVHLNAYSEEVVRLKVGDRIEVCNTLWEWVQEDGPCGREWFPCQVIGIRGDANSPDADDSDNSDTTECTIRFDSGNEYEIQSIYGWNRYNWRFIQA